MGDQSQSSKTSAPDCGLSVALRPLLDYLARKSAEHKIFNESLLTQLREGYFPSSPLERSEIDAFLLNVDSDLAECDKAITQTLGILQNYRNDLQTARDRAKALISPVRKLPLDVLIEVFEAYIGSDSALQLLRLDNRLTCRAMELTWINSYWRSVALSVSSLWSSLYIHTEACKHYTGAMELVNLHILRSRCAPLEVSIYLGDMRLEAQAVFNLLLDHSSRWYTATLLTAHSWELWMAHARARLGFEPERVALGRSPFPILEELRLGQFRVHASERCTTELFSSCPKLKKLQAIGPSVTLYQFPNLTELHVLMGELVGDCLGRALACMPRLKTCVIRSFKLEAATVRSDDFTGDDGYYHSLVTSLDIPTRCLSPDTCRALRLPQLNTLKIGGSNSSTDTSHLAGFSSFLLQSGCNLQDVTLRHLPVQHIADFLASHPSIVALQLSPVVSNVINGSYQSLFLQLCSRSIVPNLRFLTLSLERGYEHALVIPAPTSALEGWSNDICCLVESRCAASRTYAGAFQLEKFTLWVEDVRLRTFDELIRARLSPLHVLTL